MLRAGHRLYSPPFIDTLGRGSQYVTYSFLVTHLSVGEREETCRGLYGKQLFVRKIVKLDFDDEEPILSSPPRPRSCHR